MNEAVVVERYPSWTKRERELYAGALVRVLGEVDHRGLLLVELMSGELQGERRWMSEAELARTGEEA